jgi:transcriptional regulator with XRE-family HTH domain
VQNRESKPEIARKFARTLRAARSRAGLTQEELATRLGSTQSYISRVERGQSNLRFSRLADIANALGCTVSITLRRASAAPSKSA